MCKFRAYLRFRGVDWQDDIRREWSLIADNLFGPGLLYKLERHFWLDLWRTPVLEAIEECGIETRQYGPVLAFAVASAPRTPMLNIVLGAAEPGAVDGGHLADALDWTESLGVDCRIPVRPEFEESGAAEDHLNQRGYRRASSLARFVRGVAAPDFPEPPGIEVDKLPKEIEGFGDIIVEGLDLDWKADSFFCGLPGRRAWRCYTAFEESEEGAGAAAMMMHYDGMVQLGFAATEARVRGRGIHLALLRRRIVDAIAAGSRLLFADTEEAVDYPAGPPSAAARNLARAGFRLESVRPVWRPPAEMLAEDEEDEAGEEGLDEGEFDGDHDFELKD